MHTSTDASSPMSREAFLQRVRTALERAETAVPTEPPPAVDQTLARLAGPDDDLVGLFESRAASVGMQPLRVRKANLHAAITALLRQVEAQRLAVAASDFPAGAEVASALKTQGFDLLDWEQVDLDPQFATDAGITSVHHALAETGTLICCSGPGHSRGLSLIPPIHIALLPASRILPDMIDFWALPASAEARPSSICFITGPSKTADIEGILVTGVHGPKQVHILIIEDA